MFMSTASDNMNRLKACHFCGQPSCIVKRPWWFFEDAWVQVQCQFCKASGPKYVYDGLTTFESASDYAIEEWNKIK